MIIACLAYLVLPTDIIPDFIPGTGLMDDAATFNIIMEQISDEIDRYKKWNRKQKIIGGVKGIYNKLTDKIK